jgi:hypothetical protein
MEIINAIQWEHLLFVFSLVFIFLFRGPLSELIPKITKIGKDGVTAGTTAPDAQREMSNPEAVHELLGMIGNSIVISDLESRITNELKLKGFSVDGDSTKVLIRHLAGTQLLLSFEQIHNLIFGSQIFLLKKLNETTGQGRSLEFVMNHVEHVRALYPEEFEGWSNDQYLAFLYGRILILEESETIHITNFGVEYLTWITRNGRRENNLL